MDYLQLEDLNSTQWVRRIFLQTHFGRNFTLFSYFGDSLTQYKLQIKEGQKTTTKKKKPTKCVIDLDIVPT